MRAKQFFYACAGILMLVVAYGAGANRAQSQTQAARVVAATSFGQNSGGVIAILDDGRVYRGYFGESPGSWEQMTTVPGTWSAP